MSDAIEVRGLTKRFGRKQVLRGVDLAVPTGSVTALLGRNGTGKSTLLRILVGFHPATSGEARVLGLDPRRQGPLVRRRVGFVPERLELPRWMTVAEHFRFLRPFYPTWDQAEATRLLGALELDAAARVHTLSKGQRAKHALVAALSHRPALLLLDEPFSGLDPVVRHEVLGTLMGHLRDEGRTVVLVSHSMGDVERVADRVVLLDQGTVRLEGELDEIQRRTVRVVVTLDVGTERWLPPGCPAVERTGRDVVLTYIDWSESLADELARDPGVTDVRPLPRDLDDVFVATLRQESEPCAAS